MFRHVLLDPSRRQHRAHNKKSEILLAGDWVALLTEFLPRPISSRGSSAPDTKMSLSDIGMGIPRLSADAPEVAFSRSFQQRFKFYHFFMRHLVCFNGWGTIHRFSNRILSFKVFCVLLFQTPELSPQISLMSSFRSPETAPSTFCNNL